MFGEKVATILWIGKYFLEKTLPFVKGEVRL